MSFHPSMVPKNIMSVALICLCFERAEDGAFVKGERRRHGADERASNYCVIGRRNGVETAVSLPQKTMTCLWPLRQGPAFSRENLRPAVSYNNSKQFCCQAKWHIRCRWFDLRGNLPTVVSEEPAFHLFSLGCGCNNAPPWHTA